MMMMMMDAIPMWCIPEGCYTIETFWILGVWGWWLAVSIVLIPSPSPFSSAVGFPLRMNGGGVSLGVVLVESGRDFLVWFGVTGDVTVVFPFSLSPTWSSCSRRSVVLHEESAATYRTSTVSCSGGKGRRRRWICSGFSRRLWYNPQITSTMQKKDEIEAPIAMWRMSNLETDGPKIVYQCITSHEMG